MIPLGEIVRSLSKEEARNFKLFAGRIQFENKKILRLFDILKSGRYDEGSDELVKLFFPDGSRNAFYRLKNRLLEDVEKSLLMLHVNLDEKVSIINTIQLAKIFYYKSLYRQAIRMLLEAEKKALAGEYYDLLNIIYDEIITICRQYDEISPEIYIRKREDIREKHELIRNTNNTIAVLSYKLRQTNFAGKNRDFLKELDKILATLTKANKALHLSSVRLQIHECVRDILLQKKDFKNLEKYLLVSLREFEKKKFFSKATHLHKILILSWVINTLSKNKKFNESLVFTEKLHKALQDHSRLYYDKYIWTYYQSLVVNYSFSNRNRKAIELLEGLKGNPKYSGVPFYNMFLYLNLASLYYCEGDHSGAISSLSKIIIKEVFNKLAKDLQLHISVVEAILHFETGDHDYVSHKLEEIKRCYKTLLKSEEYTREKEFLEIMKELVRGSRLESKSKLFSKAESFIKNAPEFEPGSNEAINYTVWIQSKIKNKKYYELILESVNR